MIDQAPWSAYQKLVLCLAALGFLVDGIANQTLGLAVPSLMADWRAPREAFASVTAIGLVGLTIGAALGGMVGDRIGRRLMLIFSTALFGLMTMGAATAHDVGALFWFRLVDGLGIGAMIPNGAAMISEFTPQRRRSRAIALGMVFIAIGAVLAGAVATPILPAYGWRTLFFILGALPVGLALVFAFLLPESPRFLARRPGRITDLKKILGRCGLGLADGAQVAEAGPAASNPSWRRILFDKDVRPTTLALWTGFFFCLLASYSMFSWVPVMLKSLGLPLSMTSLGLTVFGIGGVAGGVASGWLIERSGLRLATLGLAAGGIVAALLLGALTHGGVGNPVALFSALAVQGFFISGLHNGLYTISAFIYPDYGRATGVGAAAAVGRLGAIASSYAGLIALQLGGASGYFVLIAAALTASLMAIALTSRVVLHAPSSPAVTAPAA